MSVFNLFNQHVLANPWWFQCQPHTFLKKSIPQNVIFFLSNKWCRATFFSDKITCSKREECTIPLIFDETKISSNNHVPSLALRICIKKRWEHVHQRRGLPTSGYCEERCIPATSKSYVRHHGANSWDFTFFSTTIDRANSSCQSKIGESTFGLITFSFALKMDNIFDQVDVWRFAWWYE